MGGYAGSRPRFQSLWKEGATPLRMGARRGQVLPGGEHARHLAGEQRQEILLDAVRRGLDDPPHLMAAAAHDEGGQIADVVLLEEIGGLLLVVVHAAIADLAGDGARFGV